ncbi:MAG: acyltransferase family protein [Beijerinckiaceae bacterium]
MPASPSPRSNQDAAFRSDAEGLRALAILGVLLFHFDLLGAKGGFAGVDIFFVISGYLITGILARGGPMDAGRAWRFAVKRFWRIAPAYYAAVLVTLGIAGYVFLPHDIGDAARSAIASSFFVSNFHFNNEAGYFEGPALYKPLLHTWSLAVEIQFYLIWPLLFWTTRHAPENRPRIILGIGIASFLACLVLSVTDEKFAFYMLPTRLWEFCAGALVALRSLPAPVNDRVRSDGPALAALLVLAASPWLLNERWLWPAPGALIPVVATAWLLAGDGTGLPARVLSHPALRFIGRISYSLYLVHWPIAVFLNYLLPPEPELAWRLAGFAASWPLGYILYRVLEMPGRSIGKMPAVPRRLTAGLVIVPVLIGACGVSLLATRAAQRPRDVEANVCPRMLNFAGAERCVLGDVAVIPDTVLWGDSHARHFSPGFDSLLREQKRAAILLTANECPPVENAADVVGRIRQVTACDLLNKAAIEALAQQNGHWDIYFAARWNHYGAASQTIRARINRMILSRRRHETMVGEQGHQRVTAGLEKIVTVLRPHVARMTVVEQVPELKFDVRHCRDILAARGASQSRCTLPRSAVDEAQKDITRWLHAVGARHPTLRLVDPKTVLCDASVCHATLDGEFAYRDNNHITDEGSRFVLNALRHHIAK